MKKFLSILLSTVLLVSLSISAPFSTKAEASSNVDAFIDVVLAGDGITINGISYNSVDFYTMNPSTFIATVGGINDLYTWKDGNKQFGYLRAWKQMEKSKFVGTYGDVYQQNNGLSKPWTHVDFQHVDFSSGKANQKVNYLTYTPTIDNSSSMEGWTFFKIAGESTVYLTTGYGKFMTPYLDIENSKVLTNFLQANNINSLEELRNYLGFTVYSDLSNSQTTYNTPFETKRGDGSLLGTYTMDEDSISFAVMTDIPNVFVGIEIVERPNNQGMMIHYFYQYMQ